MKGKRPLGFITYGRILFAAEYITYNGSSLLLFFHFVVSQENKILRRNWYFHFNFIAAYGRERERVSTHGEICLNDENLDLLTCLYVCGEGKLQTCFLKNQTTMWLKCTQVLCIFCFSVWTMSYRVFLHILCYVCFLPRQMNHFIDFSLSSTFVLYSTSLVRKIITQAIHYLSFQCTQS